MKNPTIKRLHFNQVGERHFQRQKEQKKEKLTLKDLFRVMRGKENTGKASLSYSTGKRLNLTLIYKKGTMVNQDTTGQFY